MPGVDDASPAGPGLDAPDLAPRLREALLGADYTVDAVAATLGDTAYAALQRNETAPGLRATSEGSPVETLTRLFLLQTSVSTVEVERALPGLLGSLVEAGVLTSDGPAGTEVRAALDVRPYAAEDQDLWVVSDLTPGMDGLPVSVGPDYVLGISPASTSLARLTLREPVARAWDLGTGCGVQALHLAGHSREVVATDVNRRALAIARFNAALNEATGIDVREGSFFDPVEGERFDLIATNPPFVISPATEQPLVYRDSGLPGDRAVELIVRSAPDHLTAGGWCQILANWAIVEDRPWDERLAEWVTGCSAFVVQREVLDPAAYVELWLKDAGLHGAPGYRERYDAWLGWLDRHRITGVGFGWINLQQGGSVHEFLDWPYEVEQPIAPAVLEWSHDTAATGDLLGARLQCRHDVRQETQGAPGAEDPETIVLRRQRGLRRARQVDTVEAALVGAPDGELTVGQLLDAIATLLERDPAALQDDYLPAVAELVAQGYLEPSES